MVAPGWSWAKPLERNIVRLEAANLGSDHFVDVVHAGEPAAPIPFRLVFIVGEVVVWKKIVLHPRCGWIVLRGSGKRPRKPHVGFPPVLIPGFLYKDIVAAEFGKVLDLSPRSHLLCPGLAIP